MQTRREWLKRMALTVAACATPGVAASALRAADAAAGQAPLFKISLAEWSLHNALLRDKTLDHLDFPNTAKSLGIDAVEYVNQMFMDKATDAKYLAELKKRCGDEGVTSVLIMCDREGDLGDPDAAKRAKAVENHHKWADAAKFLGCHSIRVNAKSAGSYDEQIKLAADGLSTLADYVGKLGLNVIVENHGGLSSNGQWLSSVMKTVNKPHCGTLPDFGNFKVSPTDEYDRYKGVTELMPFAKGVSAKTYEFNAAGEEVRTDYLKMMKIVLDAGYHGYVGIEYEGNKMPEKEGILATLALLKRVREKLG